VRVPRVVDPVDQVVRGARVFRIFAEYALRNRRAQHVGRDVANAGLHAEQGQRVKKLDFVVLGIGRSQLLHGAHVGPVALFLAAGPVQQLQRGDEALFAGDGSSGAARLGRGAQLAQCRSAGLKVLLVPDRVVPGHRLAPVGHGEIRIERLRLEKTLTGIRIFEEMQQQHALDKSLLGLFRFRARRKAEAAQHTSRARRL
jgi:hypothetical protein